MDSFAALRAFVAVVEEGGFAPAGRRLGVVTSSVTRQVDALEASLRTTLLNRSTRSVTLTGVGESYFEHAVRILADLDAANLEASEAIGPPSGLLRASLPASFARLHIAPWLPLFARRYPEVRLDLTLSDDIVDLVAQRQDLAIRLGPVNEPNLVARRLATNRRVLCASPAYLSERGEPRTPAELAQHNCLTFAYGSGAKVWSFSGPTKETLRLAGSLRANSSELLREAAIGGMGLVVLAKWLVGADLEAGRLREVLPQWQAAVASGPADGGGIHAVYPPSRRSSAKVRAFVDFLAERFGSPPYWDRAGQ